MVTDEDARDRSEVRHLHGASYSSCIRFALDHRTNKDKFALELGLAAEIVRSEVFIGRVPCIPQEAVAPDSITPLVVQKATCQQKCPSPLEHPSNGSLCDTIRLGSAGRRHVT
jgi:hypothetical protein